MAWSNFHKPDTHNNASDTATNRIAGFPKANLIIAAKTPRPAAVGMMTLAR
jgi:hypothetical protein